MIRILMLLDNPFTNDRRVQRESETLAAAGYDITLACSKGNNAPVSEIRNGVKIERIFDSEPLFDVKNRSYAPAMARVLADKYNPHILHTHDREMLHIAKYFLKLKPQVKYIHDIHEMHFSFPVITEGASISVRIKSRLVHELRVLRERKDMHIVDRFITVNESLEENLRNEYKLKKKGTVIRNIPEFIEKPANEDLIRKHFGIASDVKILCFIGANIYPKVLNLEQIINEVGNQNGLALVFICADNTNKKMVEAYTKEKGMTNVYFHPLLKPIDIPKYLASVDVGLVPTWNKKNLSYWYALDNKLFEYMMSEIPILATDQPEYIRIVDRFNIGITVNPDESGAYLNGLKEILKQYDIYKPRLKQAKQELNWDKEKLKLLDLYKETEKEITL